MPRARDDQGTGCSRFTLSQGAERVIYTRGGMPAKGPKRLGLAAASWPTPCNTRPQGHGFTVRQPPVNPSVRRLSWLFLPWPPLSRESLGLGDLRKRHLFRELIARLR